MYAFDGDEQFYVDLDREETVWDLPEFSKVYAFDAQEALPYIDSLKNNLRALIQRYNITQDPSGGFFLLLPPSGEGEDPWSTLRMGDRCPLLRDPPLDSLWYSRGLLAPLLTQERLS